MDGRDRQEGLACSSRRAIGPTQRRREKQRIHASVSSPLDAREAADEVLLLARDQACDTVIVGHTPQSWLSTLGGGDLAEQLVRRAKGYAVWVIG